MPKATKAAGAKKTAPSGKGKVTKATKAAPKINSTGNRVSKASTLAPEALVDKEKKNATTAPAKKGKAVTTAKASAKKAPNSPKKAASTTGSGSSTAKKASAVAAPVAAAKKSSAGLKVGDIVLHDDGFDKYRAKVEEITSTTKAIITPLENVTTSFGVIGPNFHINTYRRFMTAIHE